MFESENLKKNFISLSIKTIVFIKEFKIVKI